MASQKFIIDTITEVLSTYEYSARTLTWTRRAIDALLLVNLQKSDFGGQYYINLGAFLPLIDKNERPRINDCHIIARLRYESYDGICINSVLDLENASLSMECRRDALIHALSSVAVPFLRQCESIQVVHDALIAKQFEGAGVRKTVYQLCGLPSP